MKKINAKWVPRLLKPDQRQQRIDDSEACIELFNYNKADFLHRYVTMDKIWIHHYTPESTDDEWVVTDGGSIPKRPKSAGTLAVRLWLQYSGMRLVFCLLTILRKEKVSILNTT